MKTSAIPLAPACRLCGSVHLWRSYLCLLLSFLSCYIFSWNSFLQRYTPPHLLVFLQALSAFLLRLFMVLIFLTVPQFLGFPKHWHLFQHVIIFYLWINWSLSHFLESWVPFRIFPISAHQLLELLSFIGYAHFPLPADSINLISVLYLLFLLTSFTAPTTLLNLW